MDDADGGDDIHQASFDVDSVYEKRNEIDVDDENDDDGNERCTYRKPPSRADVF